MATLEKQGYEVFEDVVCDDDCTRLTASLPAIDNAGTRILLSMLPFRDLVNDIRAHDSLRHIVHELVAIECILFRKTSDHNWSIRLHRDTVVPINGDGSWPSAGVKEGMLCAKPPRQFLDRCVAVRLQLDGAPMEDISVVPGSHLDHCNYDRDAAIPVSVPRGAALVLRPTLAHASSQLLYSGQRRVLHYVFAPRELPDNYSWYGAA